MYRMYVGVFMGMDPLADWILTRAKPVAYTTYRRYCLSKGFNMSVLLPPSKNICLAFHAVKEKILPFFFISSVQKGPLDVFWIRLFLVFF